MNVVRNAWKIDHPDNALMRSFQDSSLWESRKLEGNDAVKRLIREGVEYIDGVRSDRHRYVGAALGAIRTPRYYLF